jgi:lantibiotic biosynthesis protein
VRLVTAGWFLLRAPLLPAGEGTPEALRAHPLGTLAVELASPDLAQALEAGRAGDRALARYARRAAFRPTPHGLLAGVTVGKLAAGTEIATGSDARAHLTVSWARLAAMGRALLEEDEGLRDKVLLRPAPSLLRAGDRLSWIMGEDEQRADLDDVLETVLEAVPTTWAKLRRRLEDDDGLIFELIEAGLLVHDLTTPLVGPPPLRWMIERLGKHAGLRKIEAALSERDVTTAQALLDSLPGAATPELHAVLVHQPRKPPTLARETAERAAALAPILFRLQEALVPPAAERDLDAGLSAQLDATVELLGAGALDATAIGLGGHGVQREELPRPAVSPPPALLALLVDKLASGASEIALTASELDAVLPPGTPPPTFELLLTPDGEGGGMLALHGPAGATAGRFAHALGDALPLGELAALEEQARPGEETVDVSFCPDPSLADLACHPPVRARTLAITAWPDGEAVTPAELEVVVDPTLPEPRSLRAAGQPVAPSPLSRLRSTTAPAGLAQLLVGWRLVRQHAPWALQLGPLAGLTRTPRISIGGFVIAPASWRLPAARETLPRRVQIGAEDELLPVDLDEDPGELEGADRCFEIYPLTTPDRDGRRVEVVIPVVTMDDDATRAIALTAAAPSVTVPTPASGWRTFKLFGPPERQDRVLLEVIGPLTAGLKRWFFQRYVDGPGHREHLRLRVHGAPGFEERLEAALVPARAAGDVVLVEVGPYHPETARLGAAEPHFQAESELILALIGLDADPVELLVRAFDSLAGGELDTRLALAGRLRAAYGEPDDGPEEYRRRQAGLLAALDGTLEDEATAPLARYAKQRRDETRLPVFLHLLAVRLLGPDPDGERLAVMLWQRALEGVRGKQRGARKSSPRRRT